MDPSSTWFVANGQVVRRDLDDAGDRWTPPVAFADALGPLLTLGVTGLPTGAQIGGGFGLPNGQVVITTDQGWVTLDPQRGVLVDGPFDQTRWLCLHGVDLGELTVGLPGSRALFLDIGRSTYSIFDPVRATLDGPNPLSGLSFSSPGGPVTMYLAEDTVAACLIPPGWLYLFGPDGDYRYYDTISLSTGNVVHPLVDDFYELSTPGFVPQNIISVADVDGAPAALPEPPDDAVLRAVVGAALDWQLLDLDPMACLLIAEAESGLRTGAFNPVGRYGLYQLDAAGLVAAGWGTAPTAVLVMPDSAQLELLEDILLKVENSPRFPSAGVIWAALLTPGEDHSTLTSATVISAPGGPHPELWQSHAVADVDGDGQIEISDLDAYLAILRGTPRWARITRRLVELGLPTSARPPG